MKPDDNTTASISVELRAHGKWQEVMADVMLWIGLACLLTLAVRAYIAWQNKRDRDRGFM